MDIKLGIRPQNASRTKGAEAGLWPTFMLY
jgi:hypothetical protein